MSVPTSYESHGHFQGGQKRCSDYPTRTRAMIEEPSVGTLNGQNQHQYRKWDGVGGSEPSGRRSELDSYSYPQDAATKRKSKNKKHNKFKTFMNMFLGGLHRHPSVHSSHDMEQKQAGSREHIDASIITKTQQKGRCRSRSVGSSPTEGHGDAQPHPQCHHGHAPFQTLTCGGADVPGLCGLYNHGNTCFMNAILQCLSNTDQLAEYMVTDQYKNDINRQKLSVHTFSSYGAVTEQFAILLKCLWNGQYEPRVTGRFKDVIGRQAGQYQGSSQHDAQEFFLWLLDCVHEDLNQAGKKKYRPMKDSTGRPDEEVAAETLQSHMKRNNSFIQNLFQGQFHSAVACPSCGTRSSTFDPYVCVSLPLPQREKRPIYVTVVYRSTSRTNRVFGVDMPIDSTIRDLRNSLAELCGMNRFRLVLNDLLPSGFNRTFYDDQHLSVVNSGDLVFGFECPPYRGDNPEAISHVNPSGSKELMLVLVINKLGQTQFGKRFGPPLILRVWRDLTHIQFQSVVLKAMASHLREGVCLADTSRSGKLFRCRVVDGLPGRSILPQDTEHLFYSPSIDKALHVSVLYGGPAHIKLVAEWEPEVKAHVFGVVADYLPEPHQSVQELRQYYQQPHTADLHDCLNIYTKEETLNREDSWFCTHCKHQQQDATKKITLWTLPDVLVIHLKRFRHIGYCRTKLNTLVSFPIQCLDMSDYLARRSTRPASTTLQQRIQTSTARAKTFSPHSKSVRFEDASAAKYIRRNANTKEKRFRFLWRKKEEEGSAKGSKATFTLGICDSPSSICSAPSTLGQAVTRHEDRVNSPSHSLDGREVHSTRHGPVGADNQYTLYAVCNHHGTMMSGHYTAYCRNPTDGRWYVFDDSHVQAISEEQLVTSSAYMLFYVRQSLVKLFPPLSAGSSSSSSNGSSSHWVMNIPRFRIDLGGSLGSSDDAHSPSNNDIKAAPHSRVGSINSAISTRAGTREFSPQSPMHDNESDVFLQSHGSVDNSSLPCCSGFHSQPVHGHTSLYHQHQLSPSHHRQGCSSSPSKHSQHLPSTTPLAIGVGDRHASLRLSRQNHPGAENLLGTSEHSYRRGINFHGSRSYHNIVRKSLTDAGKVSEMQTHAAHPWSGQGPVTPSRSIPNMTTEDYSVGNQRTTFLLPSHSIPNIMDTATTPSTPSCSAGHPHRITNYTSNSTTYNKPRHASHSICRSGTQSCV